MSTFHITKVVSSNELQGLVDALNTQTRDGHVAEIVRIKPTLWLLRIEVGHRDDFDLIRSL